MIEKDRKVASNIKETRRLLWPRAVFYFIIKISRSPKMIEISKFLRLYTLSIICSYSRTLISK